MYLSNCILLYLHKYMYDCVYIYIYMSMNQYLHVLDNGCFLAMTSSINLIFFAGTVRFGCVDIHVPHSMTMRLHGI